MLVGPKSYLKEFDFYSKESRNVKKKKTLSRIMTYFIF